MVKRGEASGLGSIGVGSANIYEKLVKSQNVGKATFRCKLNTENDTVYVTVKGKAVFKDFKNTQDNREIKFTCNPPENFCTILSELTASDIYLRIKNFYCDILDNCLGKTTSEQQDYVFRFNKPISRIRWSSGHVEKSEEYICNLPESSEHANLKDLAMQIISGILEYAHHAKDESGVEMHQYAKALLKKL